MASVHVHAGHLKPSNEYRTYRKTSKYKSHFTVQ